jgi:hypothetical protein
MISCIRILAIAVCTALVGCAMSSVTSFKDPEAGDRRYTSPIVVASNLPLSDRAQAEQKMVEAIQKKSGLRVMSGMQIFPPTRDWDGATMNAAISESGADSILIMWVTDIGSTQTYVPPQVISGGSSSTMGTATNMGGGNYSLSYSTLYTPPTVVGGYTLQKPTAQYGAALYDVSTGRKIWIGEISSRGNAFASYADLAKSAASSIVSDLSKLGLI